MANPTAWIRLQGGRFHEKTQQNYNYIYGVSFLESVDDIQIRTGDGPKGTGFIARYSEGMKVMMWNAVKRVEDGQKSLLMKVLRYATSIHSRVLVPLLAGIFLVGPIQAKEVVKFAASQPGQAKQVTLRAELYRPKGDGPFPAVVLMHGCGGWQPAVRFTMFAYAKYLTEHGFAVLNLDSFGPRRLSGGKVCESFRRLADARDYRMDDARDAKRYLQTLDFIDAENVFLMGQSNGGSVAIRVATLQDDFKAVVAYYPWCGAFGGRDVELRSPLLVLGGAKDDWVPPTYCQNVRASGAEYQLTVYPNAAHSFDLDIIPQRYLGKLIGKDEHAAEDSRAKMLSFFRSHLG